MKVLCLNFSNGKTSDYLPLVFKHLLYNRGFRNISFQEVLSGL